MRHGGDGEDLCPQVIWSVLLTEAGQDVQQLVCFSYLDWTYTVVCLPGAHRRSLLLEECKQMSQMGKRKDSPLMRILRRIFIKTTLGPMLKE